MSNSLPRTIRRNAAMIGSTSRKSNSQVLGFTLPSLRAWLLPCVRVTVLSLGPAMGHSCGRLTTDDGRQTTERGEIQATSASPTSAAFEPALLVSDQGVLHPGRRQVVGDHL